MESSKRRPQVVFLIVGILLLVISFLLVKGEHPSEAIRFWSSAIQNVSFIVLTVVIIDLLWQVIGGEPITETLKALGTTLSDLRGAILLLNDSKETGLSRMFAVSGAWGTNQQWMQRLKDSKAQVDLMGYTLHVWTRGEDFESVVQAIVKAGVHVRILIMDEANPQLAALVNDEQIAALSLSAVVEEIKVAKRTFKGIGESLKGLTTTGSFEFRVLKKGLIVTQICRTDTLLTAVQYLYFAVASRTPLVEIRGSESALFRVHANEFDALWKLGIQQ